MNKKPFTDRVAGNKEMNTAQSEKRKPACVTTAYPVEMYSKERVAEFERENVVPAALAAKVRTHLRKKR